MYDNDQFTWPFSNRQDQRQVCSFALSQQTSWQCSNNGVHFAVQHFEVRIVDSAGFLFFGIRGVNQSDSDFWLYTVKKVTNLRLYCFLASLQNNAWSAHSIHMTLCILPWNINQQENVIIKGEQKGRGSDYISAKTSALYFIPLFLQHRDNNTLLWC